jgi:hypothetical protein
MNSCEPISITATPASLWKCGTTLSAIECPLAAKGAVQSYALEQEQNAALHSGGFT